MFRTPNLARPYWEFPVVPALNTPRLAPPARKIGDGTGNRHFARAVDADDSTRPDLRQGGFSFTVISCGFAGVWPALGDPSSA